MRRTSAPAGAVRRRRGIPASGAGAGGRIAAIIHDRTGGNMGSMLELTAADGFRLSAYRADPAGSPRGAVVVTQEIFGVNSHVRAVCDGFAADGYVTIAPALFDRYERNFDIGYTPEDIARGRELKARAGTDAALHDIAAARDAAASAGRVGIV